MPRRGWMLAALMLFAFSLTYAHAQAQAPTWMELSASGGPAYLSQSVVYDPNSNYAILFGGMTGTPICCTGINDVWVLTNANGDGGTPTWIHLSPLAPNGAPAGRAYHSAVYDSLNNRMIIFGGGVMGSWWFDTMFNDAWVLTNANGTGGTPEWIPLTVSGAMPSPREGQSAVYDPATNRMIIFGGGNNGVMVVPNDTWVLTNANGLGGTPSWTQLAPTGTIPPPLERSAVGYDSALNRMVLFGGCCYWTDQTYVLLNANGTGGIPQWQQLPTTGSPGIREVHTFGYDADTQSLLIYGTGSWGINYTDAWSLSNAVGVGGSSVWTNLISNNAPGSPPFTFPGNGTYDPVNKRLITTTKGNAGELDVWVMGTWTTSIAPADLARSVVGSGYLWGGKGWDWTDKTFVADTGIIAGYHYYNPNTGTISFGDGLDCSGLVFWAYNKASGTTVYQKKTNPIYYEGADAQYWYNSTDVAPANLATGDLLFFDWDGDGHMDHVAMYVGGDDVVQASSPAVGIIISSKTSLLQKYAGSVFTRRVTPPTIGAQVIAHSPVTLSVTDPDGLNITSQTRTVTATEVLREVPKSLYYSEYAIGGDNNFEDMVTVPVLKAGAYLITPVPIPGTPSTATYSLDFVTGSVTVQLAKDKPISGIPVEGFGILSTGTGVAVPFIPVAIDIKPGSFPKTINLGAYGDLPVAIVSSADFDATTIDPNTIDVSGASIALRKNGTTITSLEDVNGDGRLDLVVHVPVQDLQLSSSATEIVLLGNTYTGQMIRGTGTVQIVP